ncbi:helix-turn-helix domain-containing protein [Bowmanella dokdonensis]|uniref:Helix-turn-helix domain-containing protein n=1 Tax=Bowmanella dokdonensis TaxID=751969 RepID=A0A939IQN4_9ALTE|nr:helix-turn-helix domain-containing protein [Bowmanella dokdonensis]MBN7824762.1 helix-turn-helix domain-containing protein [Bowmanella dokdonensis]
MDSKQIRQALHDKGFTYQMLGKQLGIHAQTFSNVAARRASSYHAAEAIAKALGKSIIEVFPDVPSYRHGPQLRQDAKTKAAKERELAALLNS